MATILRADQADAATAVALNFDDLGAQAERLAADAQAEAARIVAEAQDEADAIRRRAFEAGRREAAAEAERRLTEQLAPARAALENASAELRDARQAWLAHWESSAVHLAAAMAARVIRGELSRRPQIPLTLIREALELAAGSPGIRLHLNPRDRQSLGDEIHALVASMSAIGGAQIVEDDAVQPGGCRVETRFGSIDQQFDAQLKRIEEELIG